MQSDTRKLLGTGTGILVVGLVSAALMQFAFGGVTREGPHTNMGWLALMITMGCLPTASLTLLLGLAKLVGERSRR